MTLASQRRWTFTLWALFVAVTVFGVWIGYELNWIRERHALLSRYGGIHFGHVPGLLWIFGEQPVGNIQLNLLDEQEGRDLTPAEKGQVEAAQRLFPEAVVRWRGESMPFQAWE